MVTVRCDLLVICLKCSKDGNKIVQIITVNLSLVSFNAWECFPVSWCGVTLCSCLESSHTFGDVVLLLVVARWPLLKYMPFAFSVIYVLSPDHVWLSYKVALLVRRMACGCRSHPSGTNVSVLRLLFSIITVYLFVCACCLSLISPSITVRVGISFLLVGSVLATKSS